MVLELQLGFVVGQEHLLTQVERGLSHGAPLTNSARAISNGNGATAEFLVAWRLCLRHGGRVIADSAR